MGASPAALVSTPDKLAAANQHLCAFLEAGSGGPQAIAYSLKGQITHV